MKFYELAEGAVFTFRGRTFTKVGMSMAHEERGWGTVVMGEAEVVSDGPMLPPDVAEEWRPRRGVWEAVVRGVESGE